MTYHVQENEGRGGPCFVALPLELAYLARAGEGVADTDKLITPRINTKDDGAMPVANRRFAGDRFFKEVSGLLHVECFHFVTFLGCRAETAARSVKQLRLEALQHRPCRIDGGTKIALDQDQG